VSVHHPSAFGAEPRLSTLRSMLILLLTPFYILSKLHKAPSAIQIFLVVSKDIDGKNIKAR
jgi:hypothetical protein